MRSCRASLAALLALALAAPACLGQSGGRHAAPVFDRHTPARAPLPDESERQAARLAALVLASQPDSAAAALQRLGDEERARRARGEPPTGLYDDAVDLLHALDGARAYAEHARRMLDAGDPDPELARRLEEYLASRPLEVAQRRLREDRRRKLGVVFNRIAAPVSRFALGGTLHPIETGRAALASLLIMRSFPEATAQERQALRAYRDFLERNPDAPEAEAVRAEVAKYDEQWRRHLHEEAVEVAERAIEGGSPEVARIHLDRAERLLAEQPRTVELRGQVERALREREARVERALGAGDLLGAPLAAEEREALARLARVTAAGALSAPSLLSHEWTLERGGDGPLSDELAFLKTFDLRATGDEDAFFEALERIARRDPERSSMSRHAARLLIDPETNPYAAYRAAREGAWWAKLRWVLLGNRADGPVRRELPGALEYVLDLPGFAVAIATTPLRLLQYPSARTRFSGPVIHNGERYVARHPTGQHADEVRGELESLYEQRSQWSQALAHHRGRRSPDPATVAHYRERIAERTLEASRMQRRPDVRAKLLRSVVTGYADTPQAEQAREELRRLVSEYTPQSIRLSRAFLIENPELWGPGALALNPGLLDGEGDNDELAEEGITLIGQTHILVPLEGREPRVETVPEEGFARFVALLDEISYRQLTTDERETPVADPQRDLFFERARLGLSGDAPDLRPTATSTAEYLSTREKYGLVKRRDSILPVELVLQGGLEDFGVSAFPRMRLPRESPDAFLYE